VGSQYGYGEDSNYLHGAKISLLFGKMD